MAEQQQQIILKHGGYRKLLSYQKAEIVYDATVLFTARFLKKGDRTIDQMVQAARSGKQNIAEASLASGTSKKMEITLTNDRGHACITAMFSAAHSSLPLLL